VKKEEKPKIVVTAGDRLREIRRRKGYRTQAAFAEALGVSADQVGRAERADNPIPAEILIALAQKFGVNAHWVLVGEGLSGLEKPSEKPPRTEGRDMPVQSVPAEPILGVSRLIEPGYREVFREEIEGDPRGRYVPLIDRLAAGAGFGTDEADAHMPGDADSFVAYEGAPPGTFALRVAGDSMEPEFKSGDVVIIDPAREAPDGEVACIVYEDAQGNRVTRLKRYHLKENDVVLASNKPTHPPVEIPLGWLKRRYAIRDHLPRIVERRTW
jgi:phage repressor protein C with HTH and peptisase S24 domain